MYWMYRSDPSRLSMYYTHDDFLQTLVTFGHVGLAAIGMTLVLVFAFWFLGRGVATPFPFAGFLWVALGGCLAHAKFDFPFQIYSLQLMFLSICALLTSVSRR
jgi:O-antigen ligase